MDVSQEEGIIESEELDMINNVFDFGDARAKDIMVPKVDISMISTTTTYDELLDFCLLYTSWYNNIDICPQFF